MIEPVAAKHMDCAPIGCRGLGRCLRESASGKAYLFEYYGEQLWIPKKVLIFAEGGYWAPRWAVESAKEFAQNR